MFKVVFMINFNNNSKRIMFLFMLIITSFILLIFLINKANKPTLALEEQSGVYDGVDYKITSSGELIIGKQGETQEFEDRYNRSAGSYPWYYHSSEITSVRFAGPVKGNGSMANMFFEMKNAKGVKRVCRGKECQVQDRIHSQRVIKELNL